MPAEGSSQCSKDAHERVKAGHKGNCLDYRTILRLLFQLSLDDALVLAGWVRVEFDNLQPSQFEHMSELLLGSLHACHMSVLWTRDVA